MINDENLNRLYDRFLGNNEISTKELKEYGFNSKDINDLIESAIINTKKNEVYTVNSSDVLYKYGNKLVIQKEYDKANLYFEKCLELEPNHLGANIRLFLQSIEKGDYNRTFQLYDNLLNDQKFNEYSNYFLYLLNKITDIPDKYRQYFNELIVGDIKKFNFNNDSVRNYMRTQTILYGKYGASLQLLVNYIDNDDNICLYDVIEIELLKKVFQVDKKNQKMITTLIKDRKYEEVVDVLSKMQQKCPLSNYNKYLLDIATKIKHINSTSMLPKRTSLNPKNFEDAIYSNNYELALKLNKEYNQKNDIDTNSSALTLALNDIDYIIKTVRKKQLEENRKINEENEYISKQIKKVLNSEDLVILENVNKNIKIKIISKVDNYSNIIAFNLDSEYLFLKYISTNEDEDLRKLLKEGNEAYNRQDYIECIGKFSKAFQILKYPNSYVCTKLGLSYLNIGNTKKANDYLTLAYYKGKEEQIDNSALIYIADKLKYIKDKEIVFKSEKEIYKVNFDEINKFILKSGLDFESACKKLNMTNEQMNNMKLLYAKYYYMSGNIKKGNMILKSVEQNKNKDESTIKLLEKIKCNKKIYINKHLDNPKQLSLNLK